MASTAALVWAGDALSGAWARQRLAAGPRHLLGPLWLRLAFNAGISFSIGSRWSAVTAIEAVAALAVLLAAWRARPGLPAWGFGLLLGGGVANTADRLISTGGRVTDFVAVGQFPVFNLADVAITAGVIMLVVEVLRGRPLVTR